jgi:hypothetical protein
MRYSLTGLVIRAGLAGAVVCFMPSLFGCGGNNQPATVSGTIQATSAMGQSATVFPNASVTLAPVINGVVGNPDTTNPATTDADGSFTILNKSSDALQITAGDMYEVFVDGVDSGKTITASSSTSTAVSTPIVVVQATLTVSVSGLSATTPATFTIADSQRLQIFSPITTSQTFMESVVANGTYTVSVTPLTGYTMTLSPTNGQASSSNNYTVSATFSSSDSSPSTFALTVVASNVPSNMSMGSSLTLTVTNAQNVSVGTATANVTTTGTGSTATFTPSLSLPYGSYGLSISDSSNNVLGTQSLTAKSGSTRKATINLHGKGSTGTTAPASEAPAKVLPNTGPKSSGQ